MIPSQLHRSFCRAAGAALFLAGCTAEGGLDDARRYESAVHGFSFTIPAGLDLREYQPEALAIGAPAAQEGFESRADIRVYQAGADLGFTDFETFALTSLRNICAADGPGVSISCTRVQLAQPFAAEAGEGQIFYLERIRADLATGQRAIDGFGPIFLFDISPSATRAQWMALAVQPPANLAQAAVDSPLLRALAGSLALPQARP